MAVLGADDPDPSGPSRDVMHLLVSAAAELASRDLSSMTPVVVEVYTSRLLDRDEFRHLCDRDRTPDAIVRAIEDLPS